MNKENLSETSQKKSTFEKNTGSSEFQITLFTERIQNLSHHFQKNKKDFSSRLGLIKMVSRRKRLLAYLKRKNFNGYQSLIKKLGLRK